MTSQAIPLPALPIDHLTAVDAYLLGREDADRDRDEQERHHDDEILSRHQRELDRLLDRVDAIERHPRWKPRESEDLAAIANAVGLLDEVAA